MTRRPAFAVIAATAVLWLTSTAAQALNLPSIFSDHMVRQQDLSAEVWGWAEPGQEVEVALAGQKKIAKADPGGNWTVTQLVEGKAEIVGDTVVVTRNAVTNPAALRSGWHETAEPNFGNGAGLPASPFRGGAC